MIYDDISKKDLIDSDFFKLYVHNLEKLQQAVFRVFGANQESDWQNMSSDDITFTEISHYLKVTFEAQISLREAYFEGKNDIISLMPSFTLFSNYRESPISFSFVSVKLPDVNEFFKNVYLNTRKMGNTVPIIMQNANPYALDVGDDSVYLFPLSSPTSSEVERLKNLFNLIQNEREKV